MLFGFNKKKKRKEGQRSNISKLKSPYLKKAVFSKKTKFVTESRKARMIPPARINPPSNRWKKVMAVILALGIAGYIVYAFFFSEFFLIRDYTVEEKSTVIESNDTINAILEVRIGQNLTLMKENELIDEIRAAQPEIKKISIKKVFPDTIVVEYEKHPTVANITNLVSGVQKKFLVDSQGFLTEENTDNPNLPYIRIETAKSLELRTTFLSDSAKAAERLDYAIKAINLFEEKFGIKILYAQLKLRERELHIYTEKHFSVMIDMEKHLGTQIEKLRKALSKLDIYNVPLLYIDLRISGTDFEKVIYKRK